MNIFTKSLMVLIAVFFILMSSLTMITALNFGVITDIYYYLSDSVVSSYYFPTVNIIISLSFLLLAVILLVLGLKSNKDKKHISKYTNMGEIKISLITVQNIVMNTASRFNEIRNIAASIIKANDDMSVIIKAQVLPDVSIPALSEQIQGKVKNEVEESTGIIVKDVKVYIQSIYSESSAKNNDGKKMIRIDPQVKNNSMINQ